MVPFQPCRNGDFRRTRARGDRGGLRGEERKKGGNQCEFGGGGRPAVGTPRAGRASTAGHRARKEKREEWPTPAAARR